MEKKEKNTSILLVFSPAFFAKILTFFLILRFWAAAPKGTMSCRTGGFCPVCPYVRPSPPQASEAASQASETASQASQTASQASEAASQTSEDASQAFEAASQAS